MRVRLVDLDEPWFEALLADCGVVLASAPPFDMVFFRVDDPAALGRLAKLREQIHSNGAIWVVRPKGGAGTGEQRRIRETDIIEAGKGARLVDNKIASFSDALSAMRLVIPVALRRR